MIDSNELARRAEKCAHDLRSEYRRDEQLEILLAFIIDARGFDFREHLERQREWSKKTFGPGDRLQGIVDHITKELAEVLAAPTDLSEWIDVTILALDGAWRAGYSPDQIIAALVAKQTKNENREWPDWRVAEPGKAIEHDRSHERRGSGMISAPRRGAMDWLRNLFSARRKVVEKGRFIPPKGTPFKGT